MATKGRFLVAAALSATLASACSSPAGPSSSKRDDANQGTTENYANHGTPEVWNLTLRLTSATGGECVGATMRSDLDAPASYLLEITPNGTNNYGTVVLKSASGGYACRFPATVDDNGFTTEGMPGYFSCDNGSTQSFTCMSGAVRRMVSLGQGLSGRFLGNEITGTWSAYWIIMSGSSDVDDDLATTATFVGSRSEGL